jgi:predicted HicB family RNase H-like nuclease
MITLEQQTDIRQVAQRLFDLSPDWVTFYREILGRHGIVREAFPTAEARLAFKETETYQSILRLLTKLREQGPVEAKEDEPTKVITVRLPKSLLESLREEAHTRHTSINKLCISKLLQFIEAEKVPRDSFD